MHTNSSNSNGGDNEVFTYRRIRKAIGLLGVFLPIVLIGLTFIDFFKTEIQPSISHYYYTNLRDIFTGTLYAVGLFLFLYKGQRNKSVLKNDNLLTNIAGVMAFGVALIPTTPKDKLDKVYTIIPYNAEWLGWVHYGFAAVLFLIFANLAINVFTIGQAENKNIPVSALNENKIYRICGYSILLFIAMIPVAAKFNLFDYSTLIFESLSLLFFGIAWLIKGRMLGDKGNVGKMLYREDNANKGYYETKQFC
jgi:hypothetical protein